tara:strand:+ start:750 stop:1094 length:345 start_codon:yes stop_codon:yes gene_type:complete
MNLKVLLNKHDVLCEQARNLLDEKVKNYSGSSGNVFNNFDRVAELGICSRERGILARIADKMGRLITHINHRGLVGNENFKDSILDLINYLIFLYCAVTFMDSDLESSEDGTDD